VLDIGANVGQYGALLRAAGFGGRIVSVEPLQTAFRQLEVRSRRDPSWVIVNKGVGAAPGSVTMNISANSYSSSVLAMEAAHLAADPDSHVVGTQVTELTTVAVLAEEHQIDPARCLLKIDTQGFESQVLEGAGDLLDQFAGVQLELSFIELYTGQELFDPLVAKVRGHGMELWSIETGISDQHGRLLQCDGLFLRPS
jgi:FkbM family methyltransferase